MALLDVHYYIVLKLAIEAGVPVSEALIIAASSGYTDFHNDGRFRTQCLDTDVLNPDTQAYVTIPFHALSGNDPYNKWVVTPNCSLAQHIMTHAVDEHNPYSFGVGAHTLADTIFHQSFVGWQDKINHNVDQPLNIARALPAIIHAEYGTDPDNLDKSWKRYGVEIDNKKRALEASIEIYRWLKVYTNSKYKCERCFDFSSEVTKLLEPLWNINDYEKRKTWLMNSCGIQYRYQEASK
jgi:hypothetical protein